MNIQTIQMDRSQARSLFLEYRNAMRARPNADDEAIMRGYRALADGSAVLDLSAAIRVAGQDAQQRPKIAIARADAKWGWFRFIGREGHGRFASAWDDREPMWWRTSKRVYVNVPAGVLSLRGDWSSVNTCRALVPSIPPRFRPPHALGGYHIMWEAEWQPRPPVDPFLLRHLGGALFVVLAQWDLTPLEQAVLAGRLAS